MSKLYEALRKLDAERAAAAGVPASRFDAVSLDQFLDLQDELLRTTTDVDALADRLAHQISTILRIAGVGIGLVEHGCYRLVAVHGTGRELLADDDGLRAEETTIAAALAGGRPLVLAPAETRPLLRRVVLPFHGDAPGVVQLLLNADTSLSPDDVALARVVATVTGMALTRALRRTAGWDRSAV